MPDGRPVANGQKYNFTIILVGYANSVLELVMGFSTDKPNRILHIDCMTRFNRIEQNRWHSRCLKILSGVNTRIYLHDTQPVLGEFLLEKQLRNDMFKIYKCIYMYVYC